MNVAHLHLMVNHLPILGTLFTAFMLGFALYVGNQPFQKLALALFVALALGGILVYWSGNQAADQIRLLPGVSTPAIDSHREAGEAAFVALLIVGAAAFLLLAVYRGADPVPRNLALAVLVASLVAAALASRAAWIGGAIRHPELWGRQSSALIQFPFQGEEAWRWHRT